MILVPSSKFQFQLGTIKRKQPRWVVWENVPFQFQLGTIKSLAAVGFSEDIVTFQFQLGTIKSLMVKYSVPSTIEHFNSN